MSDETLSTTLRIPAPATAVFDVLADPTSHEAVDGTGWVREAHDPAPLTTPGQVFRMAMHHRNHPDGDYEMVNRVELLDRPRTISWLPGQPAGNGNVEFGGWIYRYDLAPAGDGSDGTDVTLTYDWSAVPAALREHIPFPPFGPEHLENSLRNLAGIVAAS